MLTQTEALMESSRVDKKAEHAEESIISLPEWEINRLSGQSSNIGLKKCRSFPFTSLRVRVTNLEKRGGHKQQKRRPRAALFGLWQKG
jgi:hypothetical protein